MMSRRFRLGWCAACLVLACGAAEVRAQPAARDSSAAPVPLPPPAVRRWQVGLLRPDRLQHGSLSMTLGLAAGLLSRRPAAGAAAGLGLGLVKELLDIRGGEGGFDVVDLCADALGAGAAAVATHAVVN
jgi:hypothetical protein